jgi:hypothetical protein
MAEITEADRLLVSRLTDLFDLAAERFDDDPQTMERFGKLVLAALALLPTPAPIEGESFRNDAQSHHTPIPARGDTTVGLLPTVPHR